ncbi:MAG: inositol 2-dehydrogenase [Chloroflexota bacterium]|nr:MAG: inositol 2-dehydrogenase [Chloroflexota bacterium]
MTTKINVGIIGAGRIGRVHAESLAYRIPQARILAVSDVFLEAAEKCAADFQIPAAFKDHRAILENKDIEAVIICSSTDTHAQFISEAAAAGKHIFCEKPIALDLAKIDEALAMVERHQVKLQIGFNRRFDPNFKQARDQVAAGKIGTPHILRITSRDPAPPPLDYIKVSGGIFLDMTIHDFDMARYLMDSEVEEIYAAGAVLVDPAIGAAGDVDTALITLRFANGAIGAIDNSRRAVYGYDQRVEVFGSEGVVVVANNTPHQAVLSNAEGVHAALPLYFFLERYMDAYVAEMKAFIEAIQRNTPPPVTGRDGRIPVVIGLAAWKSYRENRPVKLSEIKG